MNSKLAIAHFVPRTLPELARAQGIKAAGYTGFVAEIARRAEAGELRIITVTIHGWQLPVVVPCPADSLERKGQVP